MKSRNTSATNSEPVTALAATVPDAVKVNQITKWVLSGATEYEIAEAVAAQWPGTELRPLLAKVLCELAEAGVTTAPLVLGWCIEATKFLYQRMVDIGDFAGALRAIKQIADLTKAANHATVPPPNTGRHER